MSEPYIFKLLWALAFVLIVVGIAQFIFGDKSVFGWSSLAIGFSLIAIASSNRKKQNNG